MLINPDQPIKLSYQHRLQWEESRQKDVIIYPEGVVELNQSSADILKLCDGSRNLTQIVTELEIKYATNRIYHHITEFLEVAFKNGWIDLLKIETKAAPLSFSDCNTQILEDTELHRNPFFLLSATTRDDRRRIVELADEKSLELDHEACQKARSDLTSPRTRLGAEMAWLPGVSPKKAAQLVGQLFQNPMFIRMESGLPSLAHANLMAAAFKVVDSKHYPEDLSSFIQEMAYLVDEITVDDIIRDINEDRLIAGFSEVIAKEPVETELIERKRYFKNAIKDALNRLPPKSLVEAMTLAVDSITAGGEDHAPELIDDLVDSYEVETQNFLQKEAENIRKLIKNIRDSAPSSEAVLKPLIDKLDKVITNWISVAYPIHLSMKSRGMVHKQSRDLGFDIRELAVDLFSEHNAVKQAQQIIDLLRNHFSQCPELTVHVEDDANKLAEIANKQNFAELLTPIHDLCKKASEAAEQNPLHADTQGQKIIGIVPRLLTVAERSGAPLDLINEAKDHIAFTLSICAVEYGNKTSKWRPCLILLDAANIFAVGLQAKERITQNLEIVRSNVRLYGDLEPIDSAPSLYTINGCGLTLYGSTDLDSRSGSYMATYYFVLFFVPIFPICRYRVISSGAKGYSFLGKGALRTFDKWHIAIPAFIMLFFMFMTSYSLFAKVIH